MEALATIKGWKKLFTKDGKDTGREIGSAVHIMNKTSVPFRLIVQRWKNPQMDLFSPDE